MMTRYWRNKDTRRKMTLIKSALNTLYISFMSQHTLVQLIPWAYLWQILIRKLKTRLEGKFEDTKTPQNLMEFLRRLLHTLCNN